jgi:hypothetical protein
MIKGNYRAMAKPRTGARRRAKTRSRCEWDWPPERRYLCADPILDAGLSRNDDGPPPTQCRNSNLFVQFGVLALKVAVAIVVITTVMVIVGGRLIYVLLRF